jgi:predicted component of type VI protein secretion system
VREKFALAGITIAFTITAVGAALELLGDRREKRNSAATMGDDDVRQVDVRQAEAQIRLVVAVFGHRLFEVEVREMSVRVDRLQVDIEGGLPDREDQTFDQVEHVLLVHERQLDVDLGELRLAIDAQIFVAEAPHDLEITIVAGDHEQLLEQLRALGQSVEFLRVQT